MDKKIFPDEPEIPILPNLFTAGNLVCGFFAILTILRESTRRTATLWLLFPIIRMPLFNLRGMFV